MNQVDLDGRISWRKWAKRGLIGAAFGACIVVSAGACAVAGVAAGIATARLDAGCFQCREFGTGAIINTAWALAGAGAGKGIASGFRRFGGFRAAGHAVRGGRVQRFVWGRPGTSRGSYYALQGMMGAVFTMTPNRPKRRR